jgi:hypothetical protein
MTLEVSPADGENAVTKWFGEDFGRLHPLLQTLHRRDSTLRGQVTLWFAQGRAGAMGRRLARHLGIPDVAGQHHFEVAIRHDATTMSWNRCFNHSQQMPSRFRLVGHWPDGQWIERTEPLEFTLTVSVIEGGWYWNVVGVRLRGMPLPLSLMPRVTAYKRIEDGRYRFHVGIALPGFGDVFSYSGLLELDAHE